MRVKDPAILHLVKQILKANGKRGVPQGGVLSPLLANLYLNGWTRRWQRKWTSAEEMGSGSG